MVHLSVNLLVYLLFSTCLLCFLFSFCFYVLLLQIIYVFLKERWAALTETEKKVEKEEKEICGWDGELINLVLKMWMELSGTWIYIHVCGVQIRGLAWK